jgi:hypothetical protein
MTQRHAVRQFERLPLGCAFRQSAFFLQLFIDERVHERKSHGTESVADLWPWFQVSTMPFAFQIQPDGSPRLSVSYRRYEQAFVHNVLVHLKCGTHLRPHRVRLGHATFVCTLELDPPFTPLLILILRH